MLKRIQKLLVPFDNIYGVLDVTYYLSKCLGTAPYGRRRNGTKYEYFLVQSCQYGVPISNDSIIEFFRNNSIFFSTFFDNVYWIDYFISMDS